jgi:hypothetical protein
MSRCTTAAPTTGGESGASRCRPGEVIRVPAPRRLLRAVAAVALGAGLALAPAGSAGATPCGQVPDVPTGPGAALPASGRVLVLGPHLLQIVLNGRVVRSVAVRPPVDLGDLPWLAGEADYASPLADGTTGVRLGAVLVQRPGTVVVGAGLRLELGDTGGAGPARLAGNGARLSLRHTLVVSDVPDAVVRARPAAAAGVRYLDASTLTLEDVTLDGLGGGRPGSRGTDVVAALRADAGSVVVLRRVSVTGSGRGVEVHDPARLLVAGLDGDQVRGPLLDVSGGTGARLAGVSSDGATGPAVRIRGAADTLLDGLHSTDDALALAAEGVDGLRATDVRARGDGLAVAGRGIELVALDVDAPGDAVRVGAGAEVTVRGGVLRGQAAVAAEGPTLLQDVAAAGSLRGPVRVERTAPGSATGRTWWDRPMKGAGVVVVVALVAGLGLEVLRGRSRADGARDELLAQGRDGELSLDLGEQWVR